jgi:hypothetical protein
MEPFIARDTGEPLIVLGGYRIAQNGAVMREPIVNRAVDYGADPLCDGMFRMVPSGDIVNLEERNKRLG